MVYAQQKRYFKKNYIDECPRTLFVRDIVKEIRGWTSEGEHIILCIDLNEDFTRNNGPLYRALTEEANIINVLTNKHKGLPPLATQNTGTRPIDAIMVSNELTEIENGVWIQFGSSIGDHRPAYIDIDLKVLIKKSKYKIVIVKSRRLQTGNERVLQKYLRKVEEEFKKKILLKWVEK